MSLLSTPMQKPTEGLSMHPGADQMNKVVKWGWSYQPAPWEPKPSTPRSQTVIHQHHPCQIAADSKLDKDALDAENKSGFDSEMS